MLEGLICPVCENTIEEIDLKESLKCPNCSVDLKNRKYLDFLEFLMANGIVENLDFDQLILEYHNIEEPNSGWIHCSYKSPTNNRKQTLRAFRDDKGKTQYVEYNPS